MTGEEEYRGSMAVHLPPPADADADAPPLGKFLESELALPVERYMNHDKVLFYDDVILYEDGQGHGYVKLQAKIRVMEQR